MKFCSRLSLSEVHFSTEYGYCVFEPSLGESLGATYAVHLRLIKLLVTDN